VAQQGAAWLSKAAAWLSKGAVWLSKGAAWLSRVQCDSVILWRGSGGCSMSQ
jgi:hypothetical protein